jgi:hypothetical protein
MKMRRCMTSLGWLLCGAAAMAASPDLTKGFLHPPESARPWVYWFWLNSNITSNGVTADLEAMKRAGIGGVLIMEVDQGAPVGPVPFMSASWRGMFKHVTAEAQRLGLEVNMNDDAGWNGSGGPWIKPEQSMQKVVWSETNLAGPQHFEGQLAPPPVTAGYYRDIAVQAFPAVGAFRIGRIEALAAFQVGSVSAVPQTNLPPGMVIERGQTTDLTPRMDSNGRLVWDVPAGNWTVMRFGHTSTGVENAPAPASGRGLECDKLSPVGIEANFAGMMAKLIEDVGPAAGKTLVATHIDSWENGSQNWTARMREEFQKRRGYDLMPFLPVLSGRVIGNLEISERFLWDLRQTISSLVVENYAGRMRELARQHGLRLSIEAYGGPCDDAPYAGRADEPMCEFWIGGGAMETTKEMASAAHTYGKRILGAESFTAADQEKWLEHPASIKSLGDRAFCNGVNRFVFHRYAMQPWLNYQPGMTMGPWGLHYERTETWWEYSLPWHTYLARCQFVLRQGLFVADLCYLLPEDAPQGYRDHPRQGYDFDNCSAEVVLTRMTVKNGRLVLPDGMSYRLLVLPDQQTMTLGLLRKIKELVQAGATVVGPRPTKSPSLSDYPKCDEEIKALAGELWGDCDGQSVKEHRFGQGRIVWGVTPEKLLAQMGVPADFTSRARLGFIHRSLPEAEIYFVANPKPVAVEAVGTFRVTGRSAELWQPDYGRIEPAAAWEDKDGVTKLPLRLEPSGSVFVVFRARGKQGDPVAMLTRDGKGLLPLAERGPKIVVKKAEYGVLSDAARTKDVTAKVQQIVDASEEGLSVSQFAQGGDPAPSTVKSLAIEYVVDGRQNRVTGQDGATVYLPEFGPKVVIEKAVYGVPGDAQRTRDVRAKLQRLADAGEYSFQVARMAEGDDPAFLVVKTLTVDYTLDGKPARIQGTDPETLALAQPPEVVAERVADIHRDENGRLQAEAWQPGAYEVKTASGKSQRWEVSTLPAALEVDGPWELHFPPEKGAPGQVALKDFVGDRRSFPIVHQQGAPGRVTLTNLISWSEHTNPGVKYFSGTATYTKSLRIPQELFGKYRRVYLDLGKVRIMAQVKLNGTDLGLLWKPPYQLDITKAAKPGENALEVKVINLWVNRLIGDEQLPEDSARNPDGTLKEWPQWVKEGKPSPSGRYSFTSWRLWKKDSPLQESGLLGPVRLIATDCRRLAH